MTLTLNATEDPTVLDENGNRIPVGAALVSPDAESATLAG